MEIPENIAKELEEARDYCIEQNGMSMCKNCGLDFDDLLSNQEVDFTHYTRQDVEMLVGAENMDKFDEYMFGQTCPLLDGEMEYYKHDVDRFVEMISI